MSKFFKRLLNKKPQKSKEPKEDTEFKHTESVKEQLFFDRNYTIHNFSELDVEDPRVIGFRSYGDKKLMVLDVKLPLTTIKFAFRERKKSRKSPSKKAKSTRKSPAKKKRTVKKSPKTRRSPNKRRL
jgi:hypothetical protein